MKNKDIEKKVEKPYDEKEKVLNIKEEKALKKRSRKVSAKAKKDLRKKENKAKQNNSKVMLKMKKLKPIKHISRYFIPSVFLLLMVTTLLGYFIANLINDLLNIELTLTVYVWDFLFSIIIGGFFTLVITKLFFSPMDKLNKSMENVANGDFQVRIDSHSIVNEIQCMYDNFNLMAEELNSTEILQSDFISNVSHEFKTPIGAIEGYLTLLQDENISSDEKQEYIDKIMISTKRLSDLIGNILLLSKVENRNIDCNKTTYRLDEQIRQCFVILEPKWSGKNIEPDIDLEDVEYTGNEGLLSHVWMNLIDNAIKFGKENGYIKVRLFKKDGKIIFTVEDNGDGISEENKKHIFDKFYQCDSSHRSKGNGLGLALVKRIVDAEGAEISCENVEGGGCLFTVEVADEET